MWNVRKGETSIVGPRPLLTEYLEKYTPEQARRHEVRPGITGWALVNGWQTIALSRRLAADVRFVDDWSLWLDGKIVARTCTCVFRSHGVVSGQSVDDVDDLGLTKGEGEVERAHDR